MRLRFLRTYNFTPMGERRKTVKYLMGHEATVKRADGEIVVAIGAAEEIDAPSRETEAEGPKQ